MTDDKGVGMRGHGKGFFIIPNTFSNAAFPVAFARTFIEAPSEDAAKVQFLDSLMKQRKHEDPFEGYQDSECCEEGY